MWIKSIYLFLSVKPFIYIIYRKAFIHFYQNFSGHKDNEINLKWKMRN